MKSIVFIEEPVEIISIIDSGFNLEQTIIVALSIRAQAFLIKNHLPFQNTISFFDNDSHARCLEHSNKIVTMIEKNFNYTDKSENFFGIIDWLANGIRHAATNYIIFLIEVIEKAILIHGPEQVLITNLQTSNYDGWMMNKDTYFHNELSIEIAKKFNLKTKTIKLIQTINNPIQKSKRQLKYYKSTNYNHNVNDKIVFVTNWGYNIGKVLNKIRRRHPKIKIFVYSEVVINPIKAILLRLMYRVRFLYLNRDNFTGEQINFSEIEHTLSKVLKYKNINYFNLVKPKLVNGVFPSVQDLFEKSFCLDQWFQNVRPSLTLSVHSRGISYVAGEICRAMSLDGLCISHGTVVPPKNKIEKIVNRNIGKAVILNKYPSVAIQTPWAAEFLDYYGSQSERINTGPLVFTFLNKKENDKKKKVKILHASTFKAKTNIKFWGVETHDEYLAGLNDLCNIFGNLQDIELCIKLHPLFLYESTIDDLKLFLNIPSNISISNKKIKEELRDTNLLISYSSTVIEEALINRIPVILYDRWSRYCHYPCINLDDDNFTSGTLYYTTKSSLIKKYYNQIIEGAKTEITDWSLYRPYDGTNNHFNSYIDRAIN